MKALRYLATMLAVLLAGVALQACSPRYNWREASDNGAHFVVLLPAKPASATRSVDLDGIRVDLTMTAADVDGLVFAVATAELPDAAQGEAALDAMRRALLANIDGQPTAPTTPPAPGAAPPAPPARGDASVFSHYLDLDASGRVRGEPTRLVARLGQRGKRIYQVMVLGPSARVADEQLETFFGSFKPS